MNGVLAVAALLLIGAGAVKAVGASAWKVKLPAVCEVGLGAAALIRGGSLVAAAVAAAYLAFAVWVVIALARKHQTCNCFGEADTPPTLLHVVIDLVLSAGAGVAATTGPATVTFLQGGLAAVAAWLCYLCITALPRTLAATR